MHVHHGASVFVVMSPAYVSPVWDRAVVRAILALLRVDGWTIQLSTSHITGAGASREHASDEFSRSTGAPCAR